MSHRLTLCAFAVVATSLFSPTLATGAEPIKLGELNSYTGMPAFTLPYRNGWQLGLEEVNAAGGVLGRPLEIVSRDDGAKPGDAVKAASELIAREKVTMLFGTFLSNVGLAVSDLARQRGVVFLAAEPLTDAIVWEEGNRFTFRLRPGTYVQAAMLADEAAKLPAKKWAVVAPNYEYGKSAFDAFRDLLGKARPDVSWVAEQWPALFKIDAGPTAQAIARAEPEAIYNVTFGADLAKFVREGRLRGLFDGRPVVSILAGEPDWIDPLKNEAPEGWIVTGYPWYALETPEHVAFRDAYTKRFNDHPYMGSVVGYAAVKSIAAAIKKAGSTDTEAVIAAFRGLPVDSPFGPIVFRSDNQSTMGTFVGRLTVRDGMPRMVDWKYVDGAAYLPSEEAAARLRRER